MTYQTEIENLCPQNDRRPEIEELCISAKSKIMSLFGPHVNKVNSIHDNTFSIRPEYKNFIISFNNLVHDDLTLTRIEKFNHLLSCLSRDALRIVKAFQVTKENYPKTLQRLEEGYDKNA